MSKPVPASIDAYIAAQPEQHRTALRQVRAAIRRALPKAEEAISYRIPAYRLGGRAVLFFAGWKAHYAIYPASAALIAALADDLAHVAIEGHTLRFSFDRPVPVRLIGRIARIRAAEAADNPAVDGGEIPLARRGRLRQASSPVRVKESS